MAGTGIAGALASASASASASADWLAAWSDWKNVATHYRPIE